MKPLVLFAEYPFLFRIAHGDREDLRGALMNKYPRHPEKMKLRMERIAKMGNFKVPAIWALECKIALKAYYGSYPRMAFVILWEWVYLGIHDRYWHAVLWCTDKIGWTKLRPIPGTPWFHRHGGKCDHHNCQDMDCISKSLPPWFRKVTGWDRAHNL